MAEPTYDLWKSNRIVATGTWPECAAYLERVQPQPADWAIKWGGYQLVGQPADPATLTYGDLSDLFGLPYPRPCLMCPECGERYSADRADYWDCDPTDDIMCGGCGAAMELVMPAPAVA